MKRLLLIILCTFFSVTNLFAQKDTDHYFAPMVNRASSSATDPKQTLYMSTDSVTPFEVSIMSNGVVIGTKLISKGNPGNFLVLAQYIMLTSALDQEASLYTPITKGLHLSAPTPFYATLRMYTSAHGEIIASKGKAALGQEFYSVNTPILGAQTISNFMTSVLAIENNTQVTVSGYSPNVIFTNGPAGGTPATVNFTLNKGQSFILEGKGNLGNNATGFIGAKITSTKPITMTNGNMNGQYINTSAGSDIIMDQSVPTSRLGDEFAMVKGNGDATGGLEGAIVVATQDNTAIFINGSLTAFSTINTGQYVMIPGSNYVNQSTDHYNLLIKTSKNAYVYQLLGGNTGLATNGYNYIPPLNCYLPRKIDEIGEVNRISITDNPTINLKLNIITETGAVVTLNNNPIPTTQGPFPITGTVDWVTYSVPGITGNVTVNSTKAVTAGINGGYSTAGYGGYFAGFSSVPAIVKVTGDCIPGVTIAVEDFYETYQWFLNGAPIPGANSFSYNPTVAGNYTITVAITGCDPVTTPIFAIYSCPKLTTITTNVCGSKTFTPAFTSSTQPIDLSSIVVSTPPAHGTVAINPTTGVLTYTPTVGYLGPDTFVYQFNGTTAIFFDSEIVTVNLNVVLLTTTDATIFACSYNNVGIFDLTTAVVANYPGATIKYFPTLNDLNNNTNQITNFTNYQSVAGNVYALVKTPEGCTKSAKITLSFFPAPVVTDAALVECFITADPTKGTFNLSTANVTATPGVTKAYYPTLLDAQNATNMIPDPLIYTTPSRTVYVRVTNSSQCFRIAKITLTVTLQKFSSVLVNKYICIENATTLDAGPGYTAYLWSTGATTQSINNVGIGVYTVLLTSDGCKTLQTVKVLKSVEPVITNVDINNNTVTLTVGAGNPPYQYSIDNVTWQDSNVFNNLPRGENTFYVRDSFTCLPVSLQITVPNLINAITPNGDNKNDFIDYSVLAYKKNLTFNVYDRYGNKVHTADRNNGYRWDGKFSDRKIYTGTYWYHITWNESDDKNTLIKYTGWILVKNIE